ncbi:bestrophin family protein [Herbaspirillum chlorophenolicum]|uniref:Bestrophin family protein n=1 Tax=Herbaspirillum chlorophenolicum TaxID=211589 RepID=A0ABW8EW13_9BURK
MIIRERPNFLKIFFLLQGSIVPKILPQILIVGVLSALVMFVHFRWPHFLPIYDGGPFALLGIAISVFLSFRNSACYDRWWEGRKQWGALIHSSRNLARQTCILPSEDQKHLLNLTCAFSHALVHHLRPGQNEAENVSAFLSREESLLWKKSRFPPDMIIRLMGRKLVELRAQGTIGDIPYQMLDRTIGEIAGVLAACERIRSTPIPFPYMLLLNRTAFLFCLCIPFGFAHTLGWATPFPTMLIAYTFFGLDKVGDELEDPFSMHDNGLPLSFLAKVIEINMREALGEENLPPFPVAEAYILR